MPVLDELDRDEELQQQLAQDALQGLDRLLTGSAPGDTMPCHEIGALVRLIAQAAGGSTPDTPMPEAELYGPIRFTESRH